MVDAFIVVDDNDNVVIFNAAAEYLWQLDRIAVLGQALEQLIPPEAIAPHHGLQHLVDSRVNVATERTDGRQIHIELTVSEIDVGGKTMCSALARDISARHDHDRLLQLAELGFQEASACVITDVGHRILQVNAAFTRLFGWSQKEARGRYPHELIFNYPQGWPRKDFNDIQALLCAGQSSQSEELACDRNGHPLWCALSLRPITDSSGEFFALWVLSDITHTKVDEELQSRILKAMIDEEPLPEVMNLLCREIQRISPDISATTLRVDNSGHLHPLALPAFPPDFGQYLDGTEIGPAAGCCGTAAFRGAPVLVSDIEFDPLWDKTRQQVLLLGYRACWSNPFKTRDGRVLGTLAFYFRKSFTDDQGPSRLHEQLAEVGTRLCALALKRDENRDHLHRLAFFDDLTGLPNRSLLRAQADQAIVQAKRTDERLAVLFIDLDRFKQVNDSLGRAAGDTLLRVVTNRLRETLRGADIIGRYSGDEFVIIRTPCDSQLAADLAKNLISVLSAPYLVGGLTLAPAVSIGISLFPDHGRDMDTLFHHADTAMYQAKSKGRGRFSFFSDEMNRAARERLALEVALRDTLADQRLELYYQPQVDIEHNRLHGVEALARWHHPQLGQINPPSFISLAEECGLIGQLSFWALREACRQLAQWRQNGLFIPSVSVNLSPTDFHNLELPHFLDGILRKNALAPSDLIVEITEGIVMDTNPSTLKTLNEIHALGVRLSIDDFGTGYSNLGYLRHLPVNELKLDQSFVRDLDHDRATRSLTNAVIHIGDSMELTVVAEGVEDPMQRNLLKAQGYQIIQGFLYSPPLPAAELEHWVDQNMSFTQWV
ncbi:bifunctional diguanylate cyclase/phosphodiesterase [Betaproteobacteria bacterium]|nr:bifunctional diguanylate cyclase/phosphodiesterase [Betaproteobacteria bacterium]